MMMINWGRPRAWAHWVGVLLCSGLLLGGCGGGGGSGSSNDDSTDNDSSNTALAVRGVDISMLETVEDAGGTFQLNGTRQICCPCSKPKG